VGGSALLLFRSGRSAGLLVRVREEVAVACACVLVCSAN